MRALLAAGGNGFEAPGPADFWQPLFGPENSNFTVTRPMIVSVFSAVLLCGLLLASTRRMSVVPSKAQWVAEGGYNLVRNGIARDILGSRDFLRFVPFLFSMFSLILVNNWFGIIPPIQFPTMSRIGFPLALALIVFCLYHWVGLRRMGFIGYFKHMIPPGLPKALIPLVFLLELNTYFVVRPVTLALRLFGNMFAGHLLLLLCVLGGEHLLFHSDGIGLKIAGVAAFAGGFVMTLFEAFVQFLQAYVFTLLSALYLAGSLATDESH